MELVQRPKNSTIQEDWMWIITEHCILPIVTIIVFNYGILVRQRFFQFFQRFLCSFEGAAIGITVAGQSGTAGSWSYQLNYPTYVLYDQYGYLYILDATNTRIQRWIPGATYGTTVVAANTMSNPRGMRFDPFGNLVVADFSQHRVLSFGMSCRMHFFP